MGLNYTGREGHTSYYYQDKIKAFNVAIKEAGKSQNHIRTLQAKQYITKDKADDIIMRYEEVIRGINGYINWVREKNARYKEINFFPDTLIS